MKKSIYLLLSVVLITFTLSGCSKDDDPGPAGKCFANDITLTETKLDNYPDSHTLFITFDAKNNSSQTFSIEDGSKVINARIKVTTTDGTVYESNGPLTLTELSSGATASVLLNADYGAGKTYKSYTITLACE